MVWWVKTLTVKTDDLSSKPKFTVERKTSLLSVLL